MAREPMIIVQGRGLWLHLFTPWGGSNPTEQDASPKRQLTICLPPDSPHLQVMKAAANVAFMRAWPTTRPPGTPHNPFIALGGKHPELEEHMPHWIGVRAKSSYVVGVYDQFNNRIVDPECSIFYDGVWLNCQIAPFTFHSRGNWGVTWVLQAVQKVRDDTPIGTGGASPFGVIAGAEPAPDASPLDFGGEGMAPVPPPPPPPPPQQQPAYAPPAQAPILKDPGGIPY